MLNAATSPLSLLPQGVYRAYASNAKFVNAASMPQINFMAAAVVEMYGINAGEQRRFWKGQERRSRRASGYCWFSLHCFFKALHAGLASSPNCSQH